MPAPYPGSLPSSAWGIWIKGSVWQLLSDECWVAVLGSCVATAGFPFDLEDRLFPLLKKPSMFISDPRTLRNEYHGRPFIHDSCVSYIAGGFFAIEPLRKFGISLSNEYSELVSFRIDLFDLLAVQGIRKSLLQYHSLKASVV